MKTYNISDYTAVNEGKIAFEVADSSAEYTNGTMRIFATVKFPESVMKVNQVWQVGSSVIEGKPIIHSLSMENMFAKGILWLRGDVKSNDTVASDHCRRRGHGNSSSRSGGGICGIVILIGCLLGFL